MGITLDHVKKSFDGRPVLSDVSLTLPRRGAVCFFGPSGCGKTTLLRMICGLEAPDSGRITLPQGTRFACHFQEDRLLPWYTARENLSLVLGDRTDEWLNRIGLTEAGGLYPDELSGGMRRRVSLARALGYDAPVLVLDEPLREMDASLCDSMLMLIREAGRDRLTILVTHDQKQAEALDCQIIRLPQ